MYKVSIFKNGVETHGKETLTLQEAEQWVLDKESESKPWGYLPKRWLNEKDVTEEEILLSIDSRIVDLGGQTETEYFFEAEYTYDIQDISSQKQQEEANQDLLRFLKDTDWKVLRHRDQVDSGSTTSLTDQEYQSLLLDRQAARDSIV